MSIAKASLEISGPAPEPSALRLYCHRCGAETLADNCNHEGVCVICLTADVIAPLKAEYQRLWAKRERYMKAGVNLRPVESQLATVARRLGDRVHARISRPEVAIKLLNAHLEEAREAAERPVISSRILLPKPGDMLARRADVGRELRSLLA